MSRTIWRFSLQATGLQSVSMPRGARALSVQAQRGVPMLWALVDPDAPKVDRIIYCAGTGHPLPDRIDEVPFLGTFQIAGGMLVFHAFIEQEQEQEQ